jgi:hypothetical protein
MKRKSKSHTQHSHHPRRRRGRRGHHRRMAHLRLLRKFGSPREHGAKVLAARRRYEAARREYHLSGRNLMELKSGV